MTQILFIDDDVMALQLMSRVTSLLGFQPLISTSPRDGLSMAVDEKPALIMVDMQMDEMDGSEFVRELRGNPDAAHLPVVIFSAGTGYSDEEEARQAGANGFLYKPVGLNQLFQAIQTYTVQA